MKDHEISELDKLAWLSKTPCQTCCYGGVCRLRPGREIECNEWAERAKYAQASATVPDSCNG